MGNRSFSLKACIATAVLAAMGLPSMAQGQAEPGFLEATWMKVRQDKFAEYSQMARRIADANRRGKGDHWLAAIDMYGKDNFVWMMSPRASLSEIEPGMDKFGGAVKEMMGFSWERFVAETSKVTDSSGTELRVRRPDLSWNIKDTDTWLTQVAKSKYVATIVIRTKPGHILDFEKQIAMLRDAANGKPMMGSVTQVMFGGEPGTFWITIPLAEITDLNQIGSPRSLLGEEGYQHYSEMTAQNFVDVQYSLKRFVAEWSNPPETFLQANPKFWTVKTPVVVKPKAETPAAKPAPAGGM